VIVDASPHTPLNHTGFPDELAVSGGYSWCGVVMAVVEASILSAEFLRM